MARQIIDLPVINGADISEDDFVLIRDTSERKDKRARVGDISGNLSKIVDLVHPVGSVIELTTDSDPNSSIGGVWNSLGKVRDRRVISSRIIHYSHKALGSSVNRINFLGLYGYAFLDDMLVDKGGTLLEIPPGWHVEYKMTAEVSTSNQVKVALFLNGVSTRFANTWSGDTFRYAVSTDFFTRSDISLENTVNYGNNQGINFGYRTDSSAASQVRIYLPTLTAFLARDKESYMWERAS